MPEGPPAPIVAWRAVPGSDPARAMSGSGGLRAGGRWHSRGHLVVYLASVPSLAMLEILANTTAADLIARDYHLMRVELPAGSVDAFDLAELPEGWNAPQRVQATMHLGDAWLAGGGNLALRVPSALVPLEAEPDEHNFVFNPLHPRAREAVVTRVLRLPFDSRLKS